MKGLPKMNLNYLYLIIAQTQVTDDGANTNEMIWKISIAAIVTYFIRPFILPMFERWTTRDKKNDEIVAETSREDAKIKERLISAQEKVAAAAERAYEKQAEITLQSWELMKLQASQLQQQQVIIVAFSEDNKKDHTTSQGMISEILLILSEMKRNFPNLTKVDAFADALVKEVKDSNRTCLIQ